MLETFKSWILPASTIPEHWRDSAIATAPLLAIDLELTGLDPKKAEITSIGWVEGAGSGIRLQSCFYRVIATDSSLDQSPVIHGLVAENIAAGESLEPAIAKLGEYAQSHVWVLHNTLLDLPVILRAFRQFGLSLPPVLTLDTLRIAVYLLQKEHEALPTNAATLAACRERHGLPAAPCHNALDDAMATLELFYAQLHGMDPHGKLRIRDIIHTGALKVYATDERGKANSG